MSLLRCSSGVQGCLKFYIFGECIRFLVHPCCSFVSVHQFIWLMQCRSAVEKKTVLENLDLVLLAMDEIIDKG